jgi:esterase/lipase
MYNLAHRLSLHGHLVRVIALPGHDGVELKNCQANIQLFEQSLLAELSEITQYASAHKVPLYGIGFSLGGLMLQNPMIQEKIEKQVLLAPALFPNWYVNLMRATAYLPNCLAFPSRNQENLKANTKTVSGLYQTLFELIDKYQPTNKLETLLVLDQKDSLINFAKTINFYPEKKNLVVVDSKLSDHHLIIDESALGKEQWESLIDQIVTFLAKPAENNTERQ